MKHVEFPQPRTEPMPLHWKYRVLTTEPPGKSILTLSFIFTYAFTFANAMYFFMYIELLSNVLSFPPQGLSLAFLFFKFYLFIFGCPKSSL